MDAHKNTVNKLIMLHTRIWTRTYYTHRYVEEWAVTSIKAMTGLVERYPVLRPPFAALFGLSFATQVKSVIGGAATPHVWTQLAVPLQNAPLASEFSPPCLLTLLVFVWEAHTDPLLRAKVHEIMQEMAPVDGLNPRSFSGLGDNVRGLRAALIANQLVRFVI